MTIRWCGNHTYVDDAIASNIHQLGILDILRKEIPEQVLTTPKKRIKYSGSSHIYPFIQISHGPFRNYPSLCLFWKMPCKITPLKCWICQRLWSRVWASLLTISISASSALLLRKLCLPLLLIFMKHIWRITKNLDTFAKLNSKKLYRKCDTFTGNYKLPKYTVKIFIITFRVLLSMFCYFSI